MDAPIFCLHLYPNGAFGILVNRPVNAATLARYAHHHPKKRGEAADTLKPLLEGESPQRWIAGISVEDTRYLLCSAKDVGADPSATLPALAAQTCADSADRLWVGQKQADGSFFLAALPLQSVQGSIESLAGLRLPAVRFLPASQLTQALLKTQKDAATALVAVVELHGSSTELLAMRGGEVLATASLPTGIDAVFAAIQEKLELKFIGSAAKLAYDGIYDFGESAADLLAHFATSLSEGLTELEKKAGQSVTHLLPLNLSVETKWIEEALAAALAKQLWKLPTESSLTAVEELASLLSTSGLSPWLGNLQSSPEDLAPGLLPADLTPGFGPFLASLPAPQVAAPTPPKPAPAPSAPKAAAPVPPPTPAPLPQPPKAPQSVPPAPTSAPDKSAPPSEPTTAKANDDNRTRGLAKKGKGARFNKQKGRHLTPAHSSPPPESKPTAPLPTSAPAKPAEAAKNVEKPIAPAASTPAKTPVAPPSRAPNKAAEEPKKKKPLGLYLGIAAVVAFILLFFVFSGGDDTPPVSTRVATAPTTPVAPPALAPPPTAPTESAPKAVVETSVAPAEDAAPAVAETATPATLPSVNDPSDPIEEASLPATDPDEEIDQAAPTPVVLPTGGLLVNSSPEGAEVFLDGESVGITPLALPRVEIGNYEVRLQLQGYLPSTFAAEVSEGQIAAPAPLTLIREAGVLAISSSPEGIPFTVYQIVDESREEWSTGVTPARVADLPLTAFAIDYSRPGWALRSETVSFDQGGSVIEVNTAYTGSVLQVTSNLEGAEVFHGETLLGATPLALEDLPPQTMELHARLGIFEGDPIMITLTEGDTTEVAFEMIDYTRIFSPAEVDVTPRASTQIEPERIPYISRNETVTVRVVVDGNGLPTDPEILSSSRPSLNNLTIETIQGWRFEPAQFRGRTVRMMVTIPFVYRPIERL